MARKGPGKPSDFKDLMAQLDTDAIALDPWELEGGMENFGPQNPNAWPPQPTALENIDMAGLPAEIGAEDVYEATGKDGALGQYYINQNGDRKPTPTEIQSRRQLIQDTMQRIISAKQQPLPFDNFDGARLMGMSRNPQPSSWEELENFNKGLGETIKGESEWKQARSLDPLLAELEGGKMGLDWLTGDRDFALKEKQGMSDFEQFLENPEGYKEFSNARYGSRGTGLGGNSVTALYYNTAKQALENAGVQVTPDIDLQLINAARNGMPRGATIRINGQEIAIDNIAGNLDVLRQQEESKTQGQKNVELAMDPKIAGEEAEARTAVELANASDIASESAQGKAVGETLGEITKKQLKAPQILSLIDEAETLLPQATSGGLSSVVSAGQQQFGISTDATKADAQLDVISAGLLNNVPRMEGPQSDADRLSYERAAGDVSNRKKSSGDRLAALQTIKKLQQKYASQNYAKDDVSGWGIKVKE